MLEKRTIGTDASLPELQRYIYSNHLQSASLELNEVAEIISYEEYHPYGTTAYQAISATINAVSKRYRYTGKERDEESGLYYHGARYYIPWLARWTAVDPLESKYAGMSPYNYCENNPVMFNDPSGNSPTDPGDGDNKKPKAKVESIADPDRPKILPVNIPGKVDNARDVRSNPPEVVLPKPVESGPFKGVILSAPINPDVQPILKADIYGVGHIGPKKDVEAIVANIKQAYQNAVLDNIRGGPGGALGYFAGGEEGSFKGAVVDQVAMSFSGAGTPYGKVEPTRPTEKPFVPTTEAPLGASRQPVATETVIGPGTKISLSTEQAAQVNQAYFQRELVGETINMAKQSEHISNSKPYLNRINVKNEFPSILTVDPQGLLNNFKAGGGLIVSNNEAHKSVIIKFDFPVGNVVDQTSGKVITQGTHFVALKYGKNIHFTPINWKN
jgi:RHS repeat-associated protein